MEFVMIFLHILGLTLSYKLWCLEIGSGSNLVVLYSSKLSVGYKEWVGLTKKSRTIDQVSDDLLIIGDRENRLYSLNLTIDASPFGPSGAVTTLTTIAPASPSTGCWDGQKMKYYITGDSEDYAVTSIYLTNSFKVKQKRTMRTEGVEAVNSCTLVDGKLIYMGCFDHKIASNDYTNEILISDVPTSATRCYGLHYHASKGMLLVGCWEDKSIFLYDSSFQYLRKFELTSLLPSNLQNYQGVARIVGDKMTMAMVLNMGNKRTVVIFSFSGTDTSTLNLKYEANTRSQDEVWCSIALDNDGGGRGGGGGGGDGGLSLKKKDGDEEAVREVVSTVISIMVLFCCCCCGCVFVLVVILIIVGLGMLGVFLLRGGGSETRHKRLYDENIGKGGEQFYMGGRGVNSDNPYYSIQSQE